MAVCGDLVAAHRRHLRGCLVSGSRRWASLPRIVLAGHWLWAVANHAALFHRDHPAAWLFATLFFAQGMLLARARAADATDDGSPGICAPRPFVGADCLQPRLSIPHVGRWLRLSANADVRRSVPDDHTHHRIPDRRVMQSLLLSAYRSSGLSVGGSAAWLFGVHADFVLPLAGVMLAVDLILKRSQVVKKLSHVVTSAVLVAMLALVPASCAFAQAAQHDHEQQAQQGAAAGGRRRRDDGRDGGEQKANTERIAALMAQVKSSSGDAKVAAMADASPFSSKSVLPCRSTARR